ncbi:MAG: hypothetical protein JWM03_851 [Rhodocyclales bacterium]|nr:hypothetical protein [Rhodocyclales bacterium]
MSDNENTNAVRSTLWREEAEPDNPFVTRSAYCLVLPLPHRPIWVSALSNARP